VSNDNENCLQKIIDGLMQPCNLICSAVVSYSEKYSSFYRDIAAYNYNISWKIKYRPYVSKSNNERYEHCSACTVWID